LLLRAVLQPRAAAAPAVRQIPRQSIDISKTAYWIRAASTGWIKQTYRKIMHTQNHITEHDLVRME